jgi:3-oxoacyl-[acyl-carrier-protein] synthase-1
MESKAFSSAGLSHAPLNSMKGYFGHTLGAAGVIETALTLKSMQQHVLLKTLGFKEYGVPEPIKVL